MWQNLTSQFPTKLCLLLYILFLIQLHKAWEWIKIAITCIWLWCVKAANKWCPLTHKQWDEPCQIFKVFYLPTDVLYISLRKHIRSYIKIAPTCFGLRPSSGGLHMSLAKVTFIKLVKVRHYGLCGCVAACCHTTA